MQKQYLRAQLATAKTHEVYAKLVELIRRAEGAVGGLWGGRWATNYSTYSVEELEQVVKEARPGGEEVEKILAIVRVDKKKGIKRIEEVLRRREMEEARRLCTEAKNYLVLNGIFVTVRVREIAYEVLRLLFSAWSDVQVATEAPGSGSWQKKYNEAVESAAKRLDDLESAMRADLLPEIAGVDSIAATSTEAK